MNNLWETLMYIDIDCALGTGFISGSTAGLPDKVRDDRFGEGAGDAFFRLNLNQFATVTISLCGSVSSFDTYLRIFPASDNEFMLPPLRANDVPLHANDDFCGLRSHINEVFLEEGDYIINVDGYRAGNEGDFNLSVECGTVIRFQPHCYLNAPMLLNVTPLGP